MKKSKKPTRLTFVMATICLNFSYSQMIEKSPAQNQLQLFQYGFSGFKSGYKPGFRIKKKLPIEAKPSPFVITPFSSFLL